MKGKIFYHHFCNNPSSTEDDRDFTIFHILTRFAEIASKHKEIRICSRIARSPNQIPT